MRHRTIRSTALAATIATGGLLLASCSVGGLIGDCFGSDTISRSRYNDLNPIEQLRYEENSCGRYTRRDNIFSNLGDLFD